MCYMKRTEKQNSTLGKSGTKLTKKTSAEKSTREQTVLSKKKTVAAPEKSVKKLKSGPAVKVSAPAPQAKRVISAAKDVKPATLKNKPVPSAKKASQKLSAKSSVKISDSAPKTKKAVIAKAVEQEKLPVLKKKTVSARKKIVEKVKSVETVKTAEALKAAASTSKVKKPSAGNSAAKQKQEKTVQPVSAKKGKTVNEKILLPLASRKAEKVVKKAE